MASLSGVSSSNMTSSLYNSANIISGLASGMDTEGMIESLVKSYQTKISQLNQKATKLEWKQEGYRSIISKMVGFSSKYTSYTSGTNLLSTGFFSSAVKVAALGKYADSVTASGKTSSNVSLNAVHQLATAAQYRTNGNMVSGDGRSIQASAGMDLEGTTTLGNLNGGLTLTYGSQTVTINFDQVADVKAMEEIRAQMEADGKEKITDADVLAELINQKLSGQKISLSGGKTADASDRIQLSVLNGAISFTDKANAGNSVYISGASGNVGTNLGITEALKNVKTDKDRITRLSINENSLTREVDNWEYLSGKTMNMSLDGVTKSITMPKIVKGEDGDDNYYIADTEDADGKLLEYNAENYTKALNSIVNAAYKGKVKVSNTATDGSLQLRFDVQEGSNLVINTSVGDALGIGRTATSYLNTSKTLGELLDEDQLGSLTPAVDEEGNELLDKSGNKLYTFEINGVKVGNYSKDSTLADLMDDINKSDAGVKVSYSQTTKNFLFEAKETGADSKVELGDGLAKAMFGVPGSSDGSGNGSSDGSNIKFSEAFKNVDWGDSDRYVEFDFPDFSYAFLATSDMTIKDVVDKLNESTAHTWHGYTFSYDETTGRIVSTSEDGDDYVPKATLKGTDIRDEDDPGVELEYKTNVSYTAGQDAVFDVTVNGEQIQMARSTNSVNIDGLTINMEGTFNTKVDEDGNPVPPDKDGKYQVENTKDAVTFKSTTDSDKIIDVIKTMIADYNTMMSEVKSAYSTMPYQSSNGAFANYEPLTDEDREGMTESAIERYEEKAKQGILFGDRTLSALYTKMNQAFSFSNRADIDALKDMGISVSYDIGSSSQVITLDEDKMRAMLDSDPDRVADLFTKTDGIMDRMKTQLDYYAKTAGEPKGILIQQAGSPLSPLSLMSNTWQTQIDNLGAQIEKWQGKLSAQVDRYTQQFSRMEQLINQMNSQSSALAGLMGGSS